MLFPSNKVVLTPQLKLVGLSGFEPETSVLSGPRSNQLSYRPAEHFSVLFNYPRGYVKPYHYPSLLVHSSSNILSIDISRLIFLNYFSGCVSGHYHFYLNHIIAVYGLMRCSRRYINTVARSKKQFLI